jgi:hypothetical protein
MGNYISKLGTETDSISLNDDNKDTKIKEEIERLKEEYIKSKEVFDK